MRKAFFYILLLLFMQNILYAQELKGKAIMGYLVDGMDDIKYKDARIAFSLWIKELSVEENLEVSINYYDTEDEILQGYKSLDFEYLALNPYFYLKNYQSLDVVSKEYWIVTKTEKKFEDRVLFVKKGSNIKSIKDLKNKNIMVRNDDYLGRIFLDKESLENMHVSSKKHLGEITSTKRYSTAILKTYFSKTDACIVPSYAFELVKEMNPAVAKQLVPIAQTSDVFIPFIGMFHKHTQKLMMEAFGRSVKVLDKTPRGQNILALFKMYGMRKIAFEDFKPLKEYYEEYLDLKKRYKVKNYDILKK